MKESKATVKSIKATARMSVKIKDNFYTFEYCEERVLPEDLTEEEVQEERAILWDCVNNECYDQVDAVFDANTKK